MSDGADGGNNQLGMHKMDGAKAGLPDLLCDYYSHQPNWSRDTLQTQWARENIWNTWICDSDREHGRESTNDRRAKVPWLNLLHLIEITTVATTSF